MPEHLSLHELVFKKPAGTSRGVLLTKPSWIYTYKMVAGYEIQTEFPVIPGLSPEYKGPIPYEEALRLFLSEAYHSLKSWSQIDFFNASSFQEFILKWNNYPSFIFGLEVLLLGIRANGNPILFDNKFTQQQAKIPINGLVWMGSLSDMRIQAKEKIEAGFRTVKLKIGALDWRQELMLLQELRAHAPSSELIIRVDANGAFDAVEVREVLQELARLEIHSIEQPIKAGQYSEMRSLCQESIIPIALDEELIGVHSIHDKRMLLTSIQPQYIILKPSLHGGFSGVMEWIQLAEEMGIGWWLTSALESSIGLSAIVQFGASYELQIPQGFGTGSLYSNNFPSPLKVDNGYIFWVNDLRKD